MKKDCVYLSIRNVLTLISKLNRAALGEVTACTLIKHDNQHPVFAQTFDQVAITAVENDEKDHVDYGNGKHSARVFLTRDTLMNLAYQLKLTDRVYSMEIDGAVTVSIVADDQYYIDRPAGEVLGRDDPNNH